MIKIKDVEYKFKVTIRGMMMFEEVMKKSFAIHTLTDTYVYMYCILTSCNDNFTMTFDDFLNEIDNDPTLSLKMTNIIFSNDEGDVKKK